MKNQEIEWLLKEKYEGVESDAFHADCKRLAAGKPLGYIIGHVPFLDCQIFLDSHPLILRPETEYWVEHAIQEIKKETHHTRGSTPRVMDLCAGSGAIGVAVAKAIPEAYVTFTEIDPAHLATIKKNLKCNFSNTANTPIDWSKYAILEADLFQCITNTFNFILSNPPYIDREAKTIEVSVEANEPHLALFGGAGGMELIERIIIGSRTKLAPPTPQNSTGGQLWIEHEPFQSEAIKVLAEQNNFTIVTHPDQYKIPRYSVLTMAK